MSFCEVAEALAASDTEQFMTNYGHKNWLPPITKALRILQIFGTIYQSRVVADAKPVSELYKANYIKFLGDAKSARTELSNIQKWGILAFLDCHDCPVQIARVFNLQAIPIIDASLKQIQESTSLSFRFVANYCSSDQLINNRLESERLAQIELDLWRRVGGVQKDPESGEVIFLSLMDMLERWAEGDEKRNDLLEKLQSCFKLSKVARRSFSKIPVASEKWKKDVREQLQRPLDPNAISSELSGSFSSVDISSPQRNKKLSPPINVEREGLNGRHIALTELEGFKKFIIAALIVEMKAMHWFLPEAAWDKFNEFLHTNDPLLRLMTVIYLSAFCLNPIFSPGPALQKRESRLESWLLAQKTLHLLMLPGKDSRFIAFLETSLLFTFCMNHLKMAPGIGERGARGHNLIFKWMGECNQDQKTKIYQKILQFNDGEKPVPGVENPLDAVFFCNDLLEKNNLTPQQTLELWLQVQCLPKWDTSAQGCYPTMREIKDFITQVEAYCYGQVLSREMVLSLFFDHPMHYRQMTAFVDLITNRTQILESKTPVLMQKYQQVLKGKENEGKFDWIEALFTLGIEPNSSAYPIRLQLVRQVQCATLAERGYAEALLHCPFLTPANVANAPIFEGWLGFFTPYGSAERGESFSIGTWVLNDKKDKLNLQTTFFQSLDRPRAFLVTRELPCSLSDFNSENFRELYCALIKLSFEKVPSLEAITWPEKINYKEPEELNAILLRSVKTEKELFQIFESYMRELEEGQFNEKLKKPAALFYFFVLLKLMTRSPFNQKKSDAIPELFLPRVLDALKGCMEPLPNGGGVTLMNRVPRNEGTLFNVAFQDYEQPICVFAENIRKGLVERVDCEMEVGKGHLQEPYTMQIVLSFEKSKGIALCATCYVQEISLTFTERLHLPSHFPMEKLERIILILLGRSMQRYYMVNKDLVKANSLSVLK